MKSEEIKKNTNMNFLNLLKKYFSDMQIREISDSPIRQIIQEEYPTFRKKEKMDSDSEWVMINSKPINILMDDLITYASLTLWTTKYIAFLNDLAKHILLQGHIQLSEEIFNIVINFGDKEEGIESSIGFALLGLADVKSRQGKHAESIHYLYKAKAIFQKLKSTNGIGLCEHLLGTIYLEKGNVDSAEKKMKMVLNMIDKKENEITYGMINVNLGIINYMKSDLEKAENYFLTALNIFDTNNDLRRAMEVKHNIGMIYIKRCEFEKANSIYKEIINTARKYHLNTVLNIAYLNQSEILIKMNKFLEANKLLNMSLEISTENNDRLTIADIYKWKGVINRTKKSYAISEKYLSTSLRLNREFQNELNFAETSLELGKLYKEKGDSKNSHLHFNNALRYFSKIDAHDEIKMIEQLMNIEK